MEWRRRPADDPADPHGVADLLARACDAAEATNVEGTRFLFSTSDMIRVSREIEQASMVAPEADLWVGVQHGHKLEVQSVVYDTLSRMGVTVHAFGQDGGTRVPGVRWTQVEADDHALAASWFVVRGGDDPHALVGFELEPTPSGRRRWEGFETRDRHLVDAIVGHLSEVAGVPVRRAEMSG